MPIFVLKRRKEFKNAIVALYGPVESCRIVVYKKVGRKLKKVCSVDGIETTKLK